MFRTIRENTNLYELMQGLFLLSVKVYLSLILSNKVSTENIIIFYALPTG
jgi:hypothetical protein